MATQETKKTYSIEIECSNCDYRGRLEIAKGTKADGKHVCPCCECQNATKAAKPRPSPAPYGIPIAPYVPVPAEPYVKPPWHPSWRDPYTLEASPHAPPKLPMTICRSVTIMSPTEPFTTTTN